jgi:hypothetical protein
MTRKYWLDLVPSLLIGAGIVASTFIAGPGLFRTLIPTLGAAAWVALQPRREPCRASVRNQ